MAYLLDADWIIHALNGHAVAAGTLLRLSSARIFVSWVTVAEIYERAFRTVNPEAHLLLFRHFLSPRTHIGLDDAIVATFAELRAYLRRRGELIPDLDLFIGATALTFDLTLLTFNRRHFDRIPGLKLHQP